MFEEIISLKNILRAWEEFLRDKKKKKDVIEFSINLEENILSLYYDLINGVYNHGQYISFVVRDPKLRIIHKAGVRDRLLHHAIFRVLYKYYDKKFIFDSYSSRNGKGTHVAIKRFRYFAWHSSMNLTRPVWILKIDIKKYFDTIDHNVLISILEKSFGNNTKLIGLLSNIIYSFEKTNGKGIPLGNLTSQLFSNIYLDQLDQYVKRILRIKYYIRYADDIIVLSHSKDDLENILIKVKNFIDKNLCLTIHPDKVFIKPWHKGIDILGFISYPRATIMRHSTKRRMIANILNSRGKRRSEQENALYSRMKFERR